MRYCASACGHCSDVDCKDIKPAEICEARKAEDRCGYEKETNILCPLTCGICTPDDRDAGTEEGEMRGEFCYNLYSKEECTTKFVAKGKCDKAKAMRYCASACGHCSDVDCKDIKPAEICEARKAEDRCGYEKETNILCPLTCGICTPDDRDAGTEEVRAVNESCRDIFEKDVCEKFNQKGKCDKAKALRYCALTCGHCSPDECNDIQSKEICEQRKAEGRCEGKGDATGVETPILCSETCGLCKN